MIFRTGDVIARRKGVVLHIGVVLAPGEVLHNTPERGEHVSSLDEFAAGRRVRLVRPACGQSHARDSSARPRAGRSYNLFTQNCEHTASRVVQGRAQSPQLRSWAVGIGMAAITFALTRHAGASSAAFALGRRLMEAFDQSAMSKTANDPAAVR